MTREEMLKEVLDSPEFAAAVDARVSKGVAEAVAQSTKISARDTNAKLERLARPSLTEFKPGGFGASQASGRR